MLMTARGNCTVTAEDVGKADGVNGVKAATVAARAKGSDIIREILAP